MPVKIATQKQKINSDNYVNIHTGELLSSEITNITSVNKQNEDLVIISSDNYIIIDSKALDYIQREFSKVETGRILQMADMV